MAARFKAVKENLERSQLFGVTPNTVVDKRLANYFWLAERATRAVAERDASGLAALNAVAELGLFDDPASDMLYQVFETLTGDLNNSCNDTLMFCRANRATAELCRSNDFWRAMCDARGYIPSRQVARLAKPDPRASAQEAQMYEQTRRNYVKYWRELYRHHCTMELQHKRRIREGREVAAAAQALRAYEASPVGQAAGAARYVGRTVQGASVALAGALGVGTAVLGTGALILAIPMGGLEALREGWEEDGMNYPTQVALQTGLTLAAMGVTATGTLVAERTGTITEETMVGWSNMMWEIVKFWVDDEDN